MNFLKSFLFIFITIISIPLHPCDENKHRPQQLTILYNPKISLEERKQSLADLISESTPLFEEYTSQQQLVLECRRTLLNENFGRNEEKIINIINVDVLMRLLLRISGEIKSTKEKRTYNKNLIRFYSNVTSPALTLMHLLWPSAEKEINQSSYIPSLSSLGEKVPYLEIYSENFATSIPFKDINFKSQSWET